MTVALLIKLAVSLLAVLLLGAFARALGMGGDIRIRDEDHARALAQQVLFGFDPVDVIVDRAGYGALLRDREGRQMLVRRHGVHFAGRLLGPDVHARLDRTQLIISTGDRYFGRSVLELGEAAQVWAARFRDIRYA